MEATSNEEYITVQQAAEYLKITRGTLDKMRAVGNGPKYHRVSERTIRYRRNEIDAWVASRQ